jgi:beta-lactam-binding protein with PASTA domain
VVLDLRTFGFRAAKRYLGYSGCRLGRITRLYSRRVRRNHVITQRPGESTVLPSGSAVDLVLSRGRRGAH